jgi:hypothetical protein
LKIPHPLDLDDLEGALAGNLADDLEADLSRPPPAGRHYSCAIRTKTDLATAGYSPYL